MGVSEHVFVMLDGEVVFQCDGEKEAEDCVETYRLNLIAKMKAEASSDLAEEATVSPSVVGNQEKP